MELMKSNSFLSEEEDDEIQLNRSPREISFENPELGLDLRRFWDWKEKKKVEAISSKRG